MWGSCQPHRVGHHNRGTETNPICNTSKPSPTNWQRHWDKYQDLTLANSPTNWHRATTTEALGRISRFNTSKQPHKLTQGHHSRHGARLSQAQHTTDPSTLKSLNAPLQDAQVAAVTVLLHSFHPSSPGHAEPRQGRVPGCLGELRHSSPLAWLAGGYAARLDRVSY